MKKFNKAITLAVSCGVIALALCGIALADPVILSGQPVQENEGGPAGGADDGSTWATATVISGPVMDIGEDYILIDAVAENGEGPTGMVNVRIDPDLTLFVNAQDGTPLSFSDITEDETVYAYIGAAMTLSLPPQTTASLIIAGLPADGSVPVFTKVASLTDNGDGTYKLSVAGGATYMVPEDCQVSPFRTRNIVTLSDVTPGANCLLWADAENTVSKIVIIQQ